MSSFDAGQNLGEIKMNKTIWALAFVVLCSGMAFAIGNASVTENTQSGWSDVTGAGSIITEGGNVSNVTLDVNTSTEKWAGAYGEVDGNLVLAENLGTANFMYTWVYDEASGGTVCVSTNNNPTWASVVGGVAATAIDTAWSFTGSDADSAANTVTTTASVTLNGASVTGNATSDTASWETVIVGGLGGGGKADYGFCVAIDSTGSNYVGNAVDYELMMPTNAAASTTETYYFYAELI